VAWDALPLLPQSISASYFFDEKGASGAFFICSVAGKSGRQVRVLVPGLIRASEKADTLARINPGTST